MQGRLPRLLGTVALAASVLLSLAPAASATPGDGLLSILVMGDSYSAGNGAGSYYGAAGCWRSSHNYGREFQQIVERSPIRQPAFVRTIACSGDTTNALAHRKSGRAPQLDAVNHGYDLIFLTIGGNDVYFKDIVKFCLIIETRERRHCRPNLDRAKRLFADGTMAKRLRKVLSAVQDRADPTAKIVLLSYPYLEGDRHYSFGGIDVGSELRKIEDTGDDVQLSVVNSLNHRPEAPKLVFISKVKRLFEGPPNHELYAERINSHRWFIQPFVDTNLNPTLRNLYYHPNRTGWRKEAELLVSDPRVPKHDPLPTSLPPLAPLPEPTPPGPTPPQGSGASVAAISAGADHACAMLSTGRINCWGNNSYGQLGDGTVTDRSLLPVKVSGIASAVAVSASAGHHAEHTCALLGTGEVVCWGNNRVGQLGNGTTGGPDACAGDPGPPQCSATPVRVTALTNAVAISAGVQHTCALLSTREIDCWGSNFYGALGAGTTIDSATPVRVGAITNATAIGASEEQSCARLATGAVDCWGINNAGSLGIGTNAGPETCNGSPCSTVPRMVSAITNASDIATNFAPCTLLADAHVACWGDGFFGQLGNGGTGSSSSPGEVSGLTNAVAVTAGTYHSCALLSTGQAACWGANRYGSQTCGFSGPCDTTPVLVAGLTNATAISAGEGFTCAVLQTGQAACWGEGGNLGDGTADDSPVPVLVRGIT